MGLIASAVVSAPNQPHAQNNPLHAKPRSQHTLGTLAFGQKQLVLSQSREPRIRTLTLSVWITRSPDSNQTTQAGFTSTAGPPAKTRTTLQATTTLQAPTHGPPPWKRQVLPAHHPADSTWPLAFQYLILLGVLWSCMMGLIASAVVSAPNQPHAQNNPL